MWALRLGVLFRFGDYRFFKEIANHLKIKVPIINHEINIDQQITCIVHGLQKIQVIPVEKISKYQHDVSQEQVSEKQLVVDKQQNKTIEQVQPQYIFAQHSQQKVSFEQALSLSQQLQLDLCLIREATEDTQPILSLSPVCKNIYSEYYQTVIKKKGKKSFKTIRLSDRINQNDIQTKFNNIKRLHQAGERRFRLETNNDSDKSEKVLVEFGQKFNKNVQPYIKSFKVPPHNKEVDKWVCMLNFDEQVAVDSVRVNKRWRRYTFQQLQNQEDKSEAQVAAFQTESVEMQKEIYYAYKEMKMKMPPKFEQMAEIEQNLKNDKYAIYRSAISDPEDATEFEWDSEEERLFQEKQARLNMEYFGQRTVQAILQEMQELKRSGYESEAFKVARFRQLKAELDVHLKKPNNDI